MFGHEIMALLFAKSLSMTVVIIPNKDNKEEFEEEAVKIHDNLSFLYKTSSSYLLKKRRNMSRCLGT